MRSIRQQGFTLVELLVVVPSTLITVAVLITVLVTMYGDLILKNGQIDLSISAQTSLFTLRDDLFFAARFGGENQPDTVDNYAPGGSWNAVSDNALIVYEAAFTQNRQTATRELVYKANAPYACNLDEVIENQYSTNTLIYFVSNGTLYRRILVPSQAGNCDTTFRAQTCPAAFATPSCRADTVIASSVKSFTLTYYDRDGDVISSSTLAANPDAFIQVHRADLSLELEKIVNTETISASANINIKKTE